MDLTTQRRDTEAVKSAPASKPVAEPTKPSRAQQAVEVLRERRKSTSSKGVQILEKTLDRLERDIEKRKAEKQKEAAA